MAVVAKGATIMTENGRYNPGDVIDGLTKAEELRLIALGHAAPLVGDAATAAGGDVRHFIAEVPDESGETKYFTAEAPFKSNDVDLLALALKAMTKSEIVDYAKEQGFEADKRMKKDDLVEVCLAQNLEVDIDALPSNGVVAIAEELKFDTDGKTLEELRDLIAGE